MTNTNKTVAKTKHPSYLCGQPQSDPYPALRALCARDSTSGFLCPSCSACLVRIVGGLACPTGCFISLCARFDCRMSGCHPAHDSDFSYSVPDQAKIADEVTLGSLASKLRAVAMGAGWSWDDIATAALEFCGSEVANWHLSDDAYPLLVDTEHHLTNDTAVSLGIDLTESSK